MMAAARTVRNELLLEEPITVPMSTTAMEPSGFGISSDPLTWIDVWNTRKTRPTEVTRAANHASHRHRLEGRCPSGNSRKKKVPSPGGKTSQFRGSCTQAIQATN